MSLTHSPTHEMTTASQPNRVWYDRCFTRADAAQVVNYTNSFSRPLGSVYEGMGSGRVMAELLVKRADGKNYFTYTVGGSTPQDQQASRHAFEQLTSVDQVALYTFDECVASLRASTRPVHIVASTPIADNAEQRVVTYGDGQVASEVFVSTERRA